MNKKSINDAKKIVVVGVSASGKSTFARKLSHTTGLPLVHMDTIWWNPGWVEVGEEEAAKQLGEITTQDSWIVEGYVPKLARALVFERADLIIYLDYPRWVAACRYLQRWWRHKNNPRPELPGSPETFSFLFLKRIWKKQEAISLDRFLKVVDPARLVVLKKPSEATSLLTALSA
jgi:adenylate kinase family enzyme